MSGCTCSLKHKGQCPSVRTVACSLKQWELCMCSLKQWQQYHVVQRSVSVSEIFSVDELLLLGTHSISTEFLALMKKVARSPMVMDVVNLPGVLKSLERLADLLGKIQKALGEYLERERASFPRLVCVFVFVCVCACA